MTYSTAQTESTEYEYTHLVLGGIGPLGDCYAYFEGETINVFGGIPGEEVVARIVRYRRRRKRYVSGLVTEVLKPSPHRVATPCPYFGPCSGCQWQHIEYSHQLRMKQDAVASELRRYSELESVAVSQTIPSPQMFNYRNHARFTVRNQGSLGFNNRITRRFVKIDDCMLMAPGINRALRSLQDKCQETTQLSIRYGVNTDDLLIQPTLQNVDIPLPSGQTHYREELLGHSFRVASPSFFQVNTRQAEKMVEMVRDRLELSKDNTLVDAYAGVGSFAILLASYVRRVIAIEESAAAIKDASENAQGTDNLEFIEAKTEEALDSMAETPDAVILDPPRVGCDPKALRALIRLAPRRVVYVSCEPETLARDLSALVNGGFRVESIEPIDMFPQTYHVETIATLRLE
ncbi:MAG: 23S rRNA (uracil(1939)-C(5))-methyltransferase RlmD [Chloroflexi bacterium]|nr:23S rRNA (uracil(1939)-C(5))-methyltransferase RlmD [Chloroflexota bacterium]